MKRGGTECLTTTGDYMPDGDKPSVAYIVDDLGGDPDTFRVSFLAWRPPSWSLVAKIITRELAQTWGTPTVPVFIDAITAGKFGDMLIIEIERCPQ